MWAEQESADEAYSICEEGLCKYETPETSRIRNPQRNSPRNSPDDETSEVHGNSHMAGFGN